MMRLAVLTSGRQDWGILHSTCLRLRDDPRFELLLLVGGMHCSNRFGRTEATVAADGFAPAERLDWITDGASPTDQAGQALSMVGAALDRCRPDAMLVVGDRFETAAAAIAATIERVPLVHLHGGEETAGSFDDALRHAITKLSHLHLVSHADHARRLLALGEAPETIHVVGAPGLDNLWRTDLPERSELEEALGIDLQPPLVIVTLHPTTLADDGTGSGVAAEVEAVVGAMERTPATYVITLPNADPGQQLVRQALLAAAQRDRRIAVDALGERRFWGLLRIADAMLGNSSSAVIEASAARVPAVNVGDRQAGRLRGDNVIDVPAGDVDAIAEALRIALSTRTRRRLSGTASPFGDGHAAGRIVEILARWTPPDPPRKAAVRIAAERQEH